MTVPGESSRPSYSTSLIIPFTHTMLVPVLDHSCVGGGQVELAELEKQFVVAAQTLHEPPAFVGYQLQLLRHHAVDDHAVNHLDSPMLSGLGEADDNLMVKKFKLPIGVGTVCDASAFEPDAGAADINRAAEVEGYEAAIQSSAGLAQSARG